MRVLMIAPQPFFQPRGTPFSVLHRLRALSKLGHEIDLLTYHIGEDVQLDGVTIHRIPGVPFVRKIAIGPSGPKIILDLFLIVKTWKMLRDNHYDLIHSHEEAGFWAAYFSRKFGILHLYDMHSSLPQQLSNFKFSSSGFLRNIFEKLEAYAVRSAAGIITICPELFEYVKRHFPEKHNSLIENVADNSIVFKNEVDADTIRKRVRTNGEIAVLYAGTFEPYQGIDLLIESSLPIIAKEPRVRFVMVGGKPEQIAGYQARVKELEVDRNFIFTGSVAPEEVPVYIEASDVLVSPRLAGNNTPLKIYSYLRSGKPIVATNHITHTQVLDSSVSVLTECSAEAFGNGVLSVLQDKALASRVSENARKLAEEKYSYEVYLNKTANLYSFLGAQLNTGVS